MRMEDRIERMKELVSLLSKAGKAYYQESREIMVVDGLNRFQGREGEEIDVVDRSHRFRQIGRAHV